MEFEVIDVVLKSQMITHIMLPSENQWSIYQIGQYFIDV